MGITSYWKKFVVVGEMRDKVVAKQTVMIFGIPIWLFVIIFFFFKLICTLRTCYCTYVYTLVTNLSVICHCLLLDVLLLTKFVNCEFLILEKLSARGGDERMGICN